MFSDTDCLFFVYLTNRTQGAMMSHVKPEHLLDYADYRRWQKIHRKLTGTNEEDSLSDNSASKFELAQFEAISAQAWTHILCQLIKVLYRRLISCQIRSPSFARRSLRSKRFCAVRE